MTAAAAAATATIAAASVVAAPASLTPLAHFKTLSLDLGLANADTVAAHLIEYSRGYAPGQTRAARLINIAEKAPEGSPLRLYAWQAAREEVLPTRDPGLYHRVKAVRAVEAVDTIWLERVERENRVTKGQLEAALNRAKSSSAKEISRLAVKELGMFFWQCGDHASAIKVLNTIKDFASSPVYQLEGHILLVEVALCARNFGFIASYASKADQLIAILKSVPANAAVTKAAALSLEVAWGLCEMDRGQFKSAAKHFCNVNADLKLEKVATCLDVATYGALCGLASFSRTEMRDSIIQNQSFKLLLEGVPVIRNLVMDFWSSRYLNFMQGLKAIRSVLLLDVYLGPHLDALLTLAHSQALCQYVLPYSTVRLDAMAVAFGCDASTLEKDVSSLVANGQIQVRLDSQNNTLIAQNDDKRAATFNQALEAGRTFVRETRAMLLRLDMLEHGIVYESSGKRKGVGGRAGSKSKRSDEGPGGVANADTDMVNNDSDASVPELYEEDR